jgi:hypothetical protein
VARDLSLFLRRNDLNPASGECRNLKAVRRGGSNAIAFGPAPFLNGEINASL